MTLRLNGSNSGFTEVKAPATAGSNTITLPASNGSANQTLKNGSTAGTLEFVTHRGFVTYAIICDQKAHNVDGGTFTSGAFRTRDLNTEIADPDEIVSISSNQFTLGAGTYLIEASAPAFNCNQHVMRLQNITTSTTVQYGQAAYARNRTDSGVQNTSVAVARVSIASSTTFEIQHQCFTTVATNGLGTQTTFAGTNSIYTVVKIYKEA